MSNQFIPSNITHDAGWFYPLASRIPLSEETFEAVLLKLGVVPSKSTWTQWLMLLLLGLGSGLFLTGVVFFFAYNWEEMHRFSRFAILGGGVVGTTLLAFWQGTEKLTGKLALTAASVLTGVLLATFGMVYQTGADSYMFFGSWAVSIVPWVLVSRFQPLWLIALVVANIAIMAWGDVMIPRFNIVGHGSWTIILTLFLLNGGVLVLRELTSLIHSPIGSGRWFPRIIILWLMGIVSFEVVGMIVDKSSLGVPYLSLLYAATLAVLFAYYSLVRRDLFVIALVMASLVLTSTTGLVELMAFGDLTSILFVTSVYIASVTAGAAHFLRSLSKRWNTQEGAK